MEIVQSIEQLQQLSTEIRTLKRGFITNFFLDPVKHGVWILKGDCMTKRIGSTLFIIKCSSTFWNVFYCSTTFEELSNDFSMFVTEYPTTMMFDIVGRDVQCKPIVELLKNKGCKEVTSLVRMSRMDNPFDYTFDESVRKATEADIPQISQLLHKYFDAKTEQIPYDEELLDYAHQGHVLICKKQEHIAGFLIYEQNSTTLYLRYWFTHPNFRDNKVGSRLLRRFFEEGRNTKRQLFWVIRTNENAIKRYKHYGFKEENMYDYVMQYN